MEELCDAISCVLAGVGQLDAIVPSRDWGGLSISCVLLPLLRVNVVLKAICQINIAPKVISIRVICVIVICLFLAFRAGWLRICVLLKTVFHSNSIGARVVICGTKAVDIRIIHAPVVVGVRRVAL